MFVMADQLVVHAIGDYVLQSDWQAQHKVTSAKPALVHAAIYTLVFLTLTRSIPALLFIGGTHFVIDRYRLAKYLCWAKNFIAPRSGWPRPWSECTATGYNPDKPAWMAVWLLIITDNLAHILLNAAALRWLT